MSAAAAGPTHDAGSVSSVTAAAYTVPTDAPEADGTFAWDSTTIVVVRVDAGGARGLGYTYGPAALVKVIEELLAPAVVGGDPFAVPACSEAMSRALRNAGQPGAGAYAASPSTAHCGTQRLASLGFPSTICSGRPGPRCPSTAAAASPPTRTSAWSSS